MTDEDESFLTRWSRRKRDAAAKSESQPHEDGARAPVQEASEEPSPTGEREPARSTADFDPNKLPGIEDISAETDISDFLRQGVPADLSRAALRRAWVADPAIRDFVGLAENAQDFNAPNEIAGFGPLPAAQVAQLLEQVFPATRSDEQDMPEGLQPHADAHRAVANSQEPVDTASESWRDGDVAGSASGDGRDAAPHHPSDESSAGELENRAARDGAPPQTNVAEARPFPARRKGRALPK